MTSSNGDMGALRTDGYVRFLQKYKLRILFSWFVSVVLLAVTGASRLLDLCKSEFSPPPGSKSAIARDELAARFGSERKTSDVVFVSALDGQDLLQNGVLKELTDATVAYLSDNLPQHMHDKLQIDGYYQMLERGPPFSTLARTFVSEGNSSAYLSLVYPKDDTRKYGYVFLPLSQDLRDRFATRAAYIGLGGSATTAVEAVGAAITSIERMDTVSLPIAFAVLAYSLRSLRLLLLPLLALFLSALISFGILGLFAEMGLEVSSATPAVAMSMLLAISIDYGLFLLTRLREEIEGKADLHVAMSRMLNYSGHIICGSGFTLACCFVSLLFFPVQFIQSIGVGVIVCICSALAVNLMIVPACILCCPRFFLVFGARSCCRKDPCLSPQQVLGGMGSTPLAVDQHSVTDTTPKSLEDTLWFRWATVATTCGAFVAVLVLLVAFGAVGAVTAASMEKSMDTFLMMPRDSMASETIRHLGESFSRGTTGPYKLLLLPKVGNTIYSGNFWADSTDLLRDIAGLYDGDSKLHGSLVSVFYSYARGEGHAVPMSIAEYLDPRAGSGDFCAMVPSNYTQACVNFARSKRCIDVLPLEPLLKRYINGTQGTDVVEMCGAFQLMLNASTTDRRDAAIATLVPSQVPASVDAVEWARRCLEVISVGRYVNVEVHLHGITPQVLDAIDAIYDRMPLVLSMTLVCCLVLVGLLTKSVAFGFVSVVLIAWTIVVVFAAGIGVYQDGVFGDSAPRQLSKDGGLAWMVPALTFTVILGLGLDYDIFLLGRICEYRSYGFGDRESFVYGVAKTGPVITSAGLIMAVAFSGLMMSDIPMLNQVSLMLVTSVLIDTFFIRSLATPAVHAPLGKRNWWPRVVPEPRARPPEPLTLS